MNLSCLRPLADYTDRIAKPAAPKKKAQQGFSKQRSSPAKAGGSGGSSNVSFGGEESARGPERSMRRASPKADTK